MYFIHTVHLSVKRLQVVFPEPTVQMSAIECYLSAQQSLWLVAALGNITDVDTVQGMRNRREGLSETQVSCLVTI